MSLHTDLQGMMPGTGYRTREASLVGGGDWVESPGGLLVPPSSQPKPMPTCIDLFAGAGGFSLGFHAAGYHVVAAADGSHPAALTYLLNLGAPETVVHVLPGFEDLGKRDAAWHEEHAGTSMTATEYFERCPGAKRKQGSNQQPGDGWISAEIDHERGSCCDHIDDPEERVEWCKSFHSTPTHRRPCLHYFLGDIYELTGEMILDALGMEVGEVTSVVGGPPCQGFSKLNRNAGPHDVRNLLVFEFGRIVLELRPKSMVMENVPEILDMLTPEGVPVVDALCRMLEDGNYGSYDALRKSLTAGLSEGVRGALRGGKSRKTEEEEPSPQMGLPL